MPMVDFLDGQDLRDLNDLLNGFLQNRIRWQISFGEYEERLDEATHAVLDIMNRPYSEPEENR